MICSEKRDLCAGYAAAKVEELVTHFALVIYESSFAVLMIVMVFLLTANSDNKRTVQNLTHGLPNSYAFRKDSTGTVQNKAENGCIQSTNVT